MFIVTKRCAAVMMHMGMIHAVADGKRKRAVAGEIRHIAGRHQRMQCKCKQQGECRCFG